MYLGFGMSSKPNASLEADPYLLSKRREILFREPFCIFSIENYLPREHSEHLRASFPEASYFTTGTDGKSYFGLRNTPSVSET